MRTRCTFLLISLSSLSFVGCSSDTTSTPDSGAMDATTTDSPSTEGGDAPVDSVAESAAEAGDAPVEAGEAGEVGEAGDGGGTGDAPSDASADGSDAASASDGDAGG